MIWLALLPLVSADTLAPGDFLDNAAAARIPPEGIESLTAALAGLVPETIEESYVAGEYYCDEDDEEPLAFEAGDLVLYPQVEEIALTTSTDHLDVTLSLSVTGEADYVYVSGDCWYFSDVDEDCDLSLTEEDPILLTAQMGVDLVLTDGGFDATVSDPDVQIDSLPNPLSNCNPADLLDSLLAMDEDFLVELVQSFLEPSLEGLGETLEESIESSLDALWFETELSLGDAVLEIALEPTELWIEESGIFLGLGGAVANDVLAPCAEDSEYAEGSELYTSSGWPELDELAWDGASSYDLALVLNRDLVDHLLWNVWASGLLCTEVSDLGGTAVTTDLLGTVLGEDFQALFETSQPARLSILAPSPPLTRFSEDPPLLVDVTDLAIDVMARLDARMCKTCGLEMDGTVGLDPNLSATALEPELVIDSDTLVFTETYTELIPEGYSQTLSDLLPTLLDSFLPSDLLPSVDIPTWQGIGLDDALWIPSDDELWLGGFALLDTTAVEPVETSGCASSMGCEAETDTGMGSSTGCEDDALGCDESTDGCSDSGCTTAPGGTVPLPLRRAGLALGLGLVFLVRRRREPGLALEGRRTRQRSP